jgi:RNA polymerase sigma-70 factor, ECF subfamily
MENTRFGQNGTAMAMDKNHHLNGDHVATVRPRADAYEDRTDNELMALISAGESEAFEMLYSRYAANIYQTVLRVVEDRALAEDLVQEVFWRVWRRSSRFAAERGQVAAWLHAMARNVGLDELRRLRARPVLIRTEVEQSRMCELADDQADVVAAAIKQEQRHMIVSALQQLPIEQRQVIELSYFGGRTYKEIAAALNHPLGTVKTRARLGLQKLKQALGMNGPRASLSL